MKALVFVLALLQGMNAYAVREVQNGGGGIRTEQGIETFFSANFSLEGEPEKATAIPGLEMLMSELANLPVKASIKGIILGSLYPTNTRKYFHVSSAKFDPEARKELVANYAKLLGVPENKVVLLAVTAPISKTTVLFDEFYQLKSYEQAALLLHEVSWIVNAGISYQAVIKMEQSSQAYFQDRTNKQAYYRFLTNLSVMAEDETLPLTPALFKDFENEVFPYDKNSEKRIPLVQLLGTRFVDAVLKQDFSAMKSRLEEGEYMTSSNEAMMYDVTMMSAAAPDSLFYPALLDYLRNYGFVDLVPANSDTGHMSYKLSEADYVDYRNKLTVEVTLPGPAKRLYMKIYDRNGDVVGRVRF